MNKCSFFQQMFPYFWSRHSWRAKTLIILTFLFLMGAKIIGVYVPIMFKDSVDALSLPNTLKSHIVLLVLAYGGLRILSQTLNDLRDVLFSRVVYRSIRYLSLDVFRHIHNLSLKYHLNRETGSLSRYIEQGVTSIERFFQFALFFILPTLLEALFISVMVITLYPVSVFGVMFITVFLYAFLTYAITNYRTRLLREKNATEAKTSQKSLDSLINYETVKYFGNEGHEAERYDDALQNYEKKSVKLRESLSYLNISQGLISSLGLVGCLWITSYLVLDNTLGLGDYVLIHAYLMQIYLPLGNLGFAYREMRESAVKMKTMLHLLDEKKDIIDSETPITHLSDNLDITFMNVFFSYDNKRSILQDISFHVPAGHTLAIVGPSGSGKSTVAKLLFRFYDIDKGEIKVGGHNIKNIQQDILRKKIGVVPQDTVLFNDTFGYNIQYGNIQADKNAIKKAVENAHLSHLIHHLPGGFDTIVGERGLKLSGGEKQRVAIARTLLKNPSIYIFDEATSSLDTQTEKDIQNNLNQISRGRTTIIIAHRLSTVVHADEIIVLEQGKIVQKGSHQDLIQDKQGQYFKMWQQQGME